MRVHKHIVFALLVFVGICSVGGGLIVWPAVHRRFQVIEEINSLHRKMLGLSDQTTEVESLAADVQALRHRTEREMKHIPTQPGLAELMRDLSLPVDGRTVADQTFTAGSPSDALTTSEPSNVRIMPLTIDMQATFDAVLAVLQATERMQRLVRVASLQLSFERDKKTEHVRSPLVAASFSLEAVYDEPVSTPGIPAP